MRPTRAPLDSWFNYNNVPDPDADSYVAVPGAACVPPSVVLPFLQFPDEDSSWRDAALCTVLDHNFFAMGKANVEESKRYCNEECTVRESCLDFALRNREEHGVWGGTSPDERRVILRDRKNANEAVSHL